MKFACHVTSSRSGARPPAPSVAKLVRRRACSLIRQASLGLVATPLVLAALGQQPGRQTTSDAVAAQNSNGQFTQRLQNIVKRAAQPEVGKGVLMVLPSGGDWKAQEELREDLAVMHHMLDKAVNESLGSDQRYRKALGVDLVFAPDSSQLREAYIEGYGALFLFRVGFPLLPSASQKESPKEQRETNSAWEEARQEVFGENPAPDNGVAMAAEPYSEERVNRLRSALLDVLKNAANIRGLKPDEGVTICVVGTTKDVGTQAAAGSSAMAGVFFRGPGAFPSTPKGTMMTIRAKKADIDAFSKGQMSADEFRRNASLAIYESEGAGGGDVFTGQGGEGIGWMYGRRP